jgi:hypothetical protein
VASQAGHTVLIRVQVPVKWKARLDELAAEQAISVSALVRILLRAGLYEQAPPR